MKKILLAATALAFASSLCLLSDGKAALKSCTQLKTEKECKGYPACKWEKEKKVTSGKKVTVVPAKCVDNPNFKRKGK